MGPRVAIEISEEVCDALASGLPIVALETALTRGEGFRGDGARRSFAPATSTRKRAPLAGGTS